MNALKMITPLLTLLLVACQTTDRPEPVAAKEALAESVLAESSKQATPPPARMPESIQKELASAELLAGLAPSRRAERRFDVSAHDVEARVFFPSLVQGTP